MIEIIHRVNKIENLEKIAFEKKDCLNLFNNLKIIIALNKDKPDFNFIKGNINKNIGSRLDVLNMTKNEFF